MSKYEALKEIRKGYHHGKRLGYKVRHVGGLRSIGVTLSPAALAETGVQLDDTLYQFVDEHGNIILVPTKNMDT